MTRAIQTPPGINLSNCRERIYGLAQGYATQDDVDRRAHVAAMKLDDWNRPGERVLDERLASQSRLTDVISGD